MYSAPECFSDKTGHEGPANASRGVWHQVHMIDALGATESLSGYTNKTV